MFLVFNLILCIDIYLLMKNPFQPPRMREVKYYVVSGSYMAGMIFSATLVYLYIYSEMDNDEKRSRQEESETQGFIINGSFQLTYSVIVYPIMAFVNTYVVACIICRLQHKGTSRRLMRTIRNRYLLYFILIIPFYGVSFMICVFNTMSKENTPTQLKDWMKTLRFILLIFGSIKASVRLCEPFVL